MSLLLSAPLELVSRIFQSCDDFRDVVALATTCKHLHSIWAHEEGTILLQVGRRTVLSFDKALLAVSIMASHMSMRLERYLKFGNRSEQQNL
jgi:hypothetical protein